MYELAAPAQDSGPRTWQPFLWWNPTTTICSTGPFTSSLLWDSIPPWADVRAAQHCFSLGEVKPQSTKPSFLLQPLWMESPKESGTVITRPLLARSLPLRSTAPNVSCVRRVISTHFRVRWLSTSAATVEGEMGPFKAFEKKKSLVLLRIWLGSIRAWLSRVFSLNWHYRWKFICTKNNN